LKAKRKWVGVQLARLEDLELIQRTPRDGDRPALLVLRDDGSGRPYDDPGEVGDHYVTILGSIISSGALTKWGAPEVTAFLAAMVAERHDGRQGTSPGTGVWFRPLEWFADEKHRYPNPARNRLPFTVSTLERGLKSLRQQGLISWKSIVADPRTHKRFKRQRNLYKNQFDALKRDRGK
jgi:hypothetical protein